LEDCKDPTIKVEPTKLYFKGVGGPEKKEHEVTLEFYKEINPEKSKYAVRDRVIEFALEKKNLDEHYWERLLKDKAKQHWLRIDFNKWKEEDDSDEEGGPAGGQDLEEMMRQMGGLGGGGMPGMGGGMPGMGGGGGGMPDISKMAERPSLDDLDDAENDSDDEELPDLE
jgi:prostaglandin-E synthase